MSEPRLVIRGDGGAALVREAGDGEPEVFEVPPWVIRHLAKGRWWMEVFAVASLPDEGQHGVAIPPGWGGLQAIVDNAHGQGRKVHVGFEETCEQNVAVASPAPLDVERLARALTQAHLYPQPPRNKPFGADTPYDMAASIAAAYALEGQPVAEEPNPNAVPDFGPQWTNKGASFGTHEDKPEQPRSQRAAMADAQWKAMPDLAKVLRAWDRGPEFIESLLSWGFRITREAAAPDPVASPAPLDVERLARALKVELNRTHRAGEYEELAEAVAAAYAAEGQPVAESPDAD